jgi:hypothetical protein
VAARSSVPMPIETSRRVGRAPSHRDEARRANS